MLKKHIDDIKIDFVLAVYDSIQSQIRHADLKVSLILSWDSITAFMLGREIASMVAGNNTNTVHVILIAFVLITLALSGIFVFGTLKPRTRSAANPDFKSLLYTGDILRLAKEAPDRMKAYLDELVKIDSNDQIYAQFVGSIVSISEIAHIKNKMFLRALASTAISFASLVALIAILGAKASIPK